MSELEGGRGREGRWEGRREGRRGGGGKDDEEEGRAIVLGSMFVDHVKKTNDV